MEGIWERMWEGRPLKDELIAAGDLLPFLSSSHSSIFLLQHLLRVEKLLGKVEQSPSESMLDALEPICSAVVGQQFLRHENEDVRVAVASCISEITRITAPEAPYDDDQMKEAFQLIVSSFENLYDNSSRSYSQRIAILETVAKVRSCLVMLDLECDSLIIEMFQHFLKAVRDHHVDNVFSDMETVMTLVLEESEEIEFDLISPLLASLKKNSQEVQPIARKLAESVIEKCSAKVKPCLLQAKNSMSFSFDDYSPIISTVCMEVNQMAQENHRCPGEQLAEGIADGATSGVTTQDYEGKLPVERNSSEEEEEKDNLPSHYDADANLGGGRADEPASDSDSGKVEFGSAQISKERSKNLMKCTASLVSPHADMDTNDKTEHITDEEVINNVDKVVAVHKDDKKEASQLSSSPKEPESEPEILISLSPRGNALDEGLSCKDRRSKSTKKDEDVTATKKAKKAATSDSPPPARKAQVPIKTSGVVERGASRSDSDTEVVKKSGKKTDARNDHTRDGTSSKKKVDGKKRVSDKDTVFSLEPSKEVKEADLEETPKTRSKRKQSLPKEIATDVKKFGEDLVGGRINVWWPMDKIFYEGVVDSFNPKTKKHKVIYTDGEVEHLNLRMEKWELNKDGVDFKEEGQESRPVTAEITSAMRKQKKAKSGSEPLATEGKAENYRDGDASSSKYKGATRSSRKSVDNSKDDVKLTKVTPKSSSKSKDVGSKSIKVGPKKSDAGKSEQADNSEDEDSGNLKALVKLGNPTKVGKDKSKTAESSRKGWKDTEERNRGKKRRIN